MFAHLRTSLELIYNRLVTHIPYNPLRIWWLRGLGAQLGENVYMFGSSEVVAPSRLVIVGNCHIGRYCRIDARGDIRVGRNVVVASHCLLVTADHDPEDPGFAGRVGSITIADRVGWQSSNGSQGLTIGEGAVVAAAGLLPEMYRHGRLSRVYRPKLSARDRPTRRIRSTMDRDGTDRSVDDLPGCVDARYIASCSNSTRRPRLS